QRRRPDADEPGELPFELFGITACGQPEIQSRVEQKLKFLGIEHLARNRDRRYARHEGSRGKSLLEVLLQEFPDACAHLSGLGHEAADRTLRWPKNSRYQAMVRSKPSSSVNSGAHFSRLRARSALRYW